MDRAANPWSDILNTEVVWISGANIAECAPIRNFTVGFDEVAASVKEWTPQRTAQVTGIAEKAIRQAAEWWGQAKTSFLMHARGIEHHTHGVLNCLGAINLVLASGDVAHGN